MSIPDGFRLTIEEAPTRADRAFIDQALDDFNAERWPGHPIERVGVMLRDADGGLVAGLDGVAYGGWLFVNNLWVSEPLRRRGVGRTLVAEAEREALKRGCHSAWLDTFSFQAPEFYPKLGYEIFATLDYPPAHRRYFLRKRLREPTLAPMALDAVDRPPHMG